jgi:hypothetical protein
MEGLDDELVPLGEAEKSQNNICASPVVGYTTMLQAVALHRVDVIKQSIMENSDSIVEPSRSHSLYTNMQFHFSTSLLILLSL